MIVAVASLLFASAVHRASQASAKELELTRETCVANQQQIEAMSQRTFAEVQLAAGAATENRELLEQMLVFEERYLSLFQATSTQRFERALAARRACFLSSLLMKPLEAKKFASRAETLLSDLIADNPSVGGYYIVMLDVFANLGALEAAHQEAIPDAELNGGELMQRVLRFLDHPSFPRDFPAFEGMISPLTKLTEIALRLDESAAAQQLAQRLASAIAELESVDGAGDSVAPEVNAAKRLLQQMRTSP